MGKKDDSSKEEKKKAPFKNDARLCKLAKDDVPDEYFADYADLVRMPKYICRKCGRAAVSKDNLCKPEKID